MTRAAQWESEFQSETVNALKKDGWTILKLDPGTGTIPKHWPDTVMLVPGGTVLWVEFKTWGGDVKEGQRRTLKLLHKAGFNVGFCDPRPGYMIPRSFSLQEIEDYDAPGYTGSNTPHG